MGYNFKTDLREIGYETVEWIFLAQDRDLWRARLDTIINLQFP
jgi:hypothetical protein